MKSDANSRHFIPNLTTARMCVKKGILGINFDQLSADIRHEGDPVGAEVHEDVMKGIGKVGSSK